ncbi:MAG: M56 family metallopeptidase [Desulfotomaculaceae bacterium]|nr:M56 family metallopeptidase [Desulfotomaculaceae bacterium]
MSSPPIVRLLLPYTIFNTIFSKESGRLSHNLRPSTENRIDEAVKKEVNSYPFILKVLSRIWLAGCLFLMLLSCVATIKFKHRTRVFKQVTDPGIQSLMEQCCQKVKIKKSIPVYMDSYFKGPCISGVTHASIYLPENFSSRLSQNELKHILLHELAHHKRKDLFYNLISFPGGFFYHQRHKLS